MTYAACLLVGVICGAIWGRWRIKVAVETARRKCSHEIVERLGRALEIFRE